MVPSICYFFFAAANEEQKAVTYFAETIALTGIGMFLELLSEPAYILAQNVQNYKLR